MLFYINPKDPTGAIDLYPHCDDKLDAPLTNRFTIIYGKVYYNGFEWTAEHIQREKERIARLEETFKVAQRVAKHEQQPCLTQRVASQ